MFWSKSSKTQGDELLSLLKDFELFCLGEKHLSPEQFQDINRELSLNAVLHIGTHRYQNTPDGKHLIWAGTDSREHDLGAADDPNVLRDYPGFHRTRSLALGHEQVEENTIINAPRRSQQVTMVKMKDGTTAVAPNYKLALRNAALKIHLKHQFNKHNRMDIWEKIYGSA